MITRSSKPSQQRIRAQNPFRTCSYPQTASSVFLSLWITSHCRFPSTAAPDLPGVTTHPLAHSKRAPVRNRDCSELRETLHSKLTFEDTMPDERRIYTCAERQRSSSSCKVLIHSRDRDNNRSSTYLYISSSRVWVEHIVVARKAPLREPILSVELY